ncbi:unnamed protein product [Musa acuminata var. zebrina]
MMSSAPSPPPLPVFNPPSSTAAPGAPAPAAAASSGAPVATPAFRIFLSRLSDSIHRSLSNRRPWSELVDRSAFSRPDSLADAASRLPPPQEPRLLPRQLRGCHRSRPRHLPHHQSFFPPRPSLPRCRLVPPPPLPPLRSAARHHGPHLLRPRDSRLPCPHDCLRYLPHLRRVASDLSLGRRCGRRRCTWGFPRPGRSIPR